MDGRLTDLSFELSVKLTQQEVNLRRLAVSKAAPAEEAKEAGKLSCFSKVYEREGRGTQSAICTGWGLASEHHGSNTSRVGSFL